MSQAHKVQEVLKQTPNNSLPTRVPGPAALYKSTSPYLKSENEEPTTTSPKSSLYLSHPFLGSEFASYDYQCRPTDSYDCTRLLRFPSRPLQDIFSAFISSRHPSLSELQAEIHLELHVATLERLSKSRTSLNDGSVLTRSSLPSTPQDKPPLNQDNFLKVKHQLPRHSPSFMPPCQARISRP